MLVELSGNGNRKSRIAKILVGMMVALFVVGCGDEDGRELLPQLPQEEQPSERPEGHPQGEKPEEQLKPVELELNCDVFAQYLQPNATLSLYQYQSDLSDAVLTTVRWDGQQWKHASTWADTVANYHFTAFYPALKVVQNETKVVHTVSAQQDKELEWRNSDLFVATALGSYPQKPILKFASVMAHLTVVLQSDNQTFTSEELRTAQILIKARRSTTLQLPQGTLKSDEAPVERITLYADNQGYHATLVPQTVNLTDDAWMEVVIGQHRFHYPYPVEKSNFMAANKQLEAGQRYVLHINVEMPTPPVQPQPDVQWANKTVWLYGITPPRDSDWGLISTPGSFQYGISWKEGCGWYDCNKLSMDGAPDNQMCWAATAANLIYWWLDANKSYIERYGKYQGPKEYKNSKDCEVFQVFKKAFANRGFRTADGLRWFFAESKVATGGNYFNGLFKIQDVSQEVSNITEERFNIFIKEALSQHKGIGFAIPLWGLYHELTLWGADFDNFGKVSAIYITDSNDLDMEEKAYTKPGYVPVGIIKHPVQYKPSNRLGGANGVFMESSIQGKYTIEIVELQFLNLLQKQWNDYFNQ